jgi:hypothetical protein
MGISIEEIRGEVEVKGISVTGVVLDLGSREVILARTVSRSLGDFDIIL